MSALAQSRVNTAVAKIKRLSRLRPTLALVLGSGFNHVLGELDVNAEIPARNCRDFRSRVWQGMTGNSSSAGSAGRRCWC